MATTWFVEVKSFRKVIRVCPEQGDQGGERSQGQDSQGVAEVTWCVQLGEEKVEGGPHQSQQLPQGGQWRAGADLLSAD